MLKEEEEEEKEEGEESSCRFAFYDAFIYRV